uniref:RNA binding motif protein 7 n=1 Tax=Pseudonaja textilis TaxID=8673 RepID=A0A670Y3T1_PSETE
SGGSQPLEFLSIHAGPVIKVKIPKDRDGKPKQFAFVNFKHEESVPYGMSLLHGIKLFGRPLKIQFRSGSSHASQEVTSPCAPHGFANGNPSKPSCPSSDTGVVGILPGRRALLSSPLLLKVTQASCLPTQMTSAWQQVPSYGGRHNSPLPESLPGGQQGYSFPWSSASPAHWRSEPPRKGRASSHPYQSGHRHHGQEQRRLADCGSNYSFRGSREDHYHDDRNYGGWS